MADERAPEEETQQEVEQDAVREPEDPVTAREEMEVALMQEGASEEGEEVGEHID